jgi:shikimate kinase
MDATPRLMHIKLKGTPGIYLVGFMGSGKSTVGRLLAQRLGWDFVDLDAEIESRYGAPIPEIFEREGEPAFRDLEHQALDEQVRLVRRGRPRVVALGGGAFAGDRNRDALATAGVSIWLECPVEVLWERISHEQHRPLARDRGAFQRLLDERLSSYLEADFRVDAEREAEQIVNAIFKLGLF